ncbi:nuclease-related domain-containing protein [Cryobacterium sp. Hz9]|uniref:nuclease-related domain-containing protein n=1 Tax=Cryobacterium sp. Hz9 TaxID=1259167 RepID=UPI00106C8245|nr:nuclease-related domain-containing protein [Cryobacterium sp. Hz9]TFB68470.1 NERD domain-containing protein [Cryobacterium sp. Hz9]
MTFDAPIMRQRCPAQSIMEVLLLEQRLVAPRSSLERLIGRSPLGAGSVRCFDAARAEIAVGLALAELPREWIVFHSLPVGESGADVDHLVIGPAGVFTLHSHRQARKSVQVTSRNVQVGARKIPYLREAEYEAGSLTALLAQRMPRPASVRGVVVLVGAKNVIVQAQPSRVKFIEAPDLCAWLQGLPPVLAPLDRLAIAGYVENPVLWQALTALEPAEILQRFAVLETEVGRARRTRQLWLLCGMVFTTFTALEMLLIVPRLLGAP